MPRQFTTHAKLNDREKKMLDCLTEAQKNEGNESLTLRNLINDAYQQLPEVIRNAQSEPKREQG